MRSTDALFNLTLVLHLLKYCPILYISNSNIELRFLVIWGGFWILGFIYFATGLLVYTEYMFHQGYAFLLFFELPSFLQGFLLF